MASEQQKHTPGPWQWDMRQDNRLSLVHPHAGYLLVMDFVRLGMQGGTARFATWKGIDRERMGGIMVPAYKIDLAVHPDARLIAAAPDLLAACEAALPILIGYIDPDIFDGHAGRALVMVRDAIKLAKEGAGGS